MTDNTEELREKLRALPRTKNTDPRYPIDAYEDDLVQLITTLAERKAREAEERAARKIQAVINAHQGLNSDSEVLKLVECSLPVIDQLEAEATLKEKNNE